MPHLGKPVVVDPHGADVVQAGVGPLGPAGFGVQGVDEDAEGRPDARAEIDHAAVDDRPAADRPEGDQVLVAQLPPVGTAGRRAAKLPDHARRSARRGSRDSRRPIRRRSCLSSRPAQRTGPSV